MGHFVSGFHCNIGSATVVLTKLWGLTLGLRLAHQLGIQCILVELDSKVVFTMISTKRTHCAYLQPVLDEALSLIQHQGWVCSMHHIFMRLTNARTSLWEWVILVDFTGLLLIMLHLRLVWHYKLMLEAVPLLD